MNTNTMPEKGEVEKLVAELKHGALAYMSASGPVYEGPTVLERKTADALTALSERLDKVEREQNKLSAYFRDEAPSAGFIGDVEGWSPVETAIRTMRGAEEDFKALRASLDEAERVLRKIAAPRGCGCSPPCRCNTAEHLEIELDEIKELAATFRGETDAAE